MKHARQLSDVALQLTADSKRLRLLAALAGVYDDDGSAAAELSRWTATRDYVE